MAKYYKEISITGTVNTTIYDAGLSSSKEEPKKLIEVWLNVSGYAGNVVELWQENERFATIPDKLLGTDADLGAANFPYSTTKILKVEVDRAIPIGETIKAAIRCGATAKNVQGCYVYELTK